MKTSKLTQTRSWLFAALFGLFVASCGNEENLPGMDGDGNDVITFTVKPDYGVNTRAALSIPQGKVLRFIMEVYDSSSNLVTGSRQVKTLTADGEVTFALIKTTKECTVVFWADYANAGDKTDWRYNTTNGLKAISMISPTGTLSGTDFGGEAFYGTTTVNASGIPASTSVTLVHAVAQVNLRSIEQLSGIGTTMQSVKVTYGEAGNVNAPMSVFNALDETVTTAATINVTNTVESSVASLPYDFHTFYFFAPKTSQNIINAKIELCSDVAGATAVTTTEISNIPLRANYRTNITGDFHNSRFSVSCSSVWGGEWEVPVSIWDGNGATPNADSKFGDITKNGDSENDAYVIASAADLAQLAANVNDGMTYENKYFKQIVDIDLDGKEWTPIGAYTSDYDQKPFKGNFDGGQHQIQGLKINSGWQYVGLFGNAAGCTIKNLHVSGDIVATSAHQNSATGGIVGMDKSSYIRNCSFRGNINAKIAAGGIIGYKHLGEVTACKNSGTIKGEKRAGGITGVQYSAPAKGCYNEGTIKGNEYIGGIIGYMSDARVEANGCYNIGEMIAGSQIPTFIAGIGGNYGRDVLVSCYVKEKYTNSHDTETVFGYGVWPSSISGTVWYANESNNGEENKYWKSLGQFFYGTSVYPKLWWED